MPTRAASALFLLLLASACGGAIEPGESSQTDQAIDGRDDEASSRDEDTGDESAPDPEPAPSTGSSKADRGACGPDELFTECTTATGAAGIRGCEDDACGTIQGPGRACDPREPGPPCSWQPVPGSQIRETCRLEEGTWHYDSMSCNTPLVLSFDADARVAFTHPHGSFDVVGAGASFETDWVSAATPWLALDRNGNGRIDDGAELFGSMTGVVGGRATNGFEALSALDDDHDGRITKTDSAWTRLVLWSDADQDRASSRSELTSLSSRGLVAIELGYGIDRHCTGTACEVERAAFTFEDGKGQTHTGAVIDVHFAAR